MASGIGGWLRWQPDIEEFSAPLRKPRPFRFLGDAFPRGIDNTHIDVVLSPEFIGRSRLFVRRALLHDVTRNYWGERPSPPDARDLQAVRDGYAGMMELTVDRARKNTRAELIQLLQFSVMKLFIMLVDNEFERLRSQLQRARSMDKNQTSGLSVQLHDRLVQLARDEPMIRYQLTRRLFRELLKIEDMRLSKLRRSVLGRSWQIPKTVMFNPILQLPSLWADEQVMLHYPLACTDRDDPDGFDRMNRLVTQLFGEYLPPWAWAPEEHKRRQYITNDIATSSRRSRRDAEDLLGRVEVSLLLEGSLQSEEYADGRISWLDTPENMDRIVYSVKQPGAIRTDYPHIPYRTFWVQKGWRKFHLRLMKRVLKQFRKSGAELDILACYAAPGIYQELARQLPVRMIARYLSNRMSRGDLKRKMAGMQSVKHPDQILKALDRGRTSITRIPVTRRRRHVYNFLRHFVLLRRDLKYAQQAYQAMESIRLLIRPEDMELSRSNGTLQEFLLREELRPGQHKIRNHVILKADVRGSTNMASELRQKNLNPASHFSLNFFEPINKLLESYGAKKVFVEGDAVILSIFEYEDTPYQWLCVSHACGLAREILKVVDVQNRNNRKHGLPELELGLGIAFSDQAPAFLYDEEQEIMISHAINRADRLSSCSASIRRSAYGKKLGRGVEVLAPVNPNVLEKHGGDELIRYNVNGIELDVPAFHKLRSELSLQGLRPDEVGVSMEGKFLVGRYPDLQGNMHWLVIREAVVRSWDGEQSGDEELHGRRFYQVVTSQELVRTITRELVKRRQRLPEAGPLQPQDAKEPRYLH
jgi:class 3 adenylate cyclase